MNSADLIQRGQKFLAKQFPATISMNGQSYECVRSGLGRDRDLMTGGWLDKKKISFLLRLEQFTAAGKPVPAARDFVQFDGADYVIAEAPLDAAQATITLRCETPEQ